MDICLIGDYTTSSYFYFHLSISPIYFIDEQISVYAQTTSNVALKKSFEKLTSSWYFHFCHW